MQGKMPVPPGLIHAAQYIRMSTEHQRYSADNQAAAIELYAAAHGYEVVQTYADLGKSGLTLRRRPGLNQLLSDVEGRRADFQTVLVYDVSRWGRFQDPDEAAACEATCKRAGVTVQYCAEMFDNDGSATASILKSLKRIMAAEYSRELSVKIYAAQRRVASFGFLASRWRPLGMRRLAVDHLGRPVRLLENDEAGIRGCHVRLVPGPATEVALVRRIFRLFGNRGWSRTRIAETLNREGVKNPNSELWTYGSIRRLLKCESYVGDYVYGKTTMRLSSTQRRVPRELWVRAEGAFEPIISRSLFKKVQKRLAEASPPTDAKMLEDLKSLIASYGYVNSTLLKIHPHVSHSGTYIKRFGSLTKAYRLVGYDPHTSRQVAALVQATQLLRNRMMDDVADVFRSAGHEAALDRTRSRVRVDEIANIEVRARRILKGPKGIWTYHSRRPVTAELTLLARLNSALETVDYCLMTSAPFCGGADIYLPKDPTPRLGLEVFTSIDELYDRCMRLLSS